MRRYEKRDRRGMTLVEIILVIAIIGILASVSVVLLGQLRYAGTQKAVRALNAALDELQVTALEKSGNYSLYVYHEGGAYYMKQVKDAADGTVDLTALTAADGTKLSNDSVVISYQDSAGSVCQVTDDSATWIRVAHTKRFSYDMTKTSAAKIIVGGVPEYTITLVEDTGKHFVEP